MPGSAGRLLVYRTYPIGTRNLDVTRALIVVHGASRDADNYFRHAQAAAFLAGALENTIILSPRFASNNGDGCRDTFANRELKWQCSGPGRWTAGGAAADEATVSSFDVADEMLRRLARRDVFPNLRAIVVAGHSAGGQFVSRYQMANEVHERLGVPVTYPYCPTTLSRSLPRPTRHDSSNSTPPKHSRRRMAHSLRASANVRVRVKSFQAFADDVVAWTSVTHADISSGR